MMSKLGFFYTGHFCLYQPYCYYKTALGGDVISILYINCTERALSKLSFIYIDKFNTCKYRSSACVFLYATELMSSFFFTEAIIHIICHITQHPWIHCICNTYTVRSNCFFFCFVFSVYLVFLVGNIVCNI